MQFLSTLFYHPKNLGSDWKNKIKPIFSVTYKKNNYYINTGNKTWERKKKKLKRLTHICCKPKRHLKVIQHLEVAFIQNLMDNIWRLEIKPIMPVIRNKMILTCSQAQDKKNLCMKKLTHTFVVNHRGILRSYDIWESLSFRTSWIIFED